MAYCGILRERVEIDRVVEGLGYRQLHDLLEAVEDALALVVAADAGPLTLLGLVQERCDLVGRDGHAAAILGQGRGRDRLGFARVDAAQGLQVPGTQGLLVAAVPEDLQALEVGAGLVLLEGGSRLHHTKVPVTKENY